MNKDIVTQESIDAALATQQRDRDEVKQTTGWLPTDAGIVVPPLVVLAAVMATPLARIHCLVDGCQWTATAKTEGRAIRSLAPHLVRSHDWAIPREGR